jgi:pimeloyl-ACP methyl ester carboxylesterase
VFVERYGTGAEVYFALHGWAADHTAFAPLAPYVPPRASLYAADLPGCGRSPAPREWSVAAITDEVAAAVMELDARDVTLVGNCAGALFALSTATRLQEHVQRVVLVDAFAYMPRYFTLFVSEGFGRRAYNATFANPFGRWLTNQALRARRDPEADLTAAFAAFDHEVARRYLALFAGAGGVAQFKDLHTSVEVVYGARSFGAVRRSAAQWCATLPRARAWRIAGARHTTMIETAAQAVSRIIFAPDTADAAHAPPSDKA